MLFYIYSNAPGTTIDITSRCRVGRLSVKDNAEEGSVAISSLIIDDPAGTLEITGHRRMYIYESEAPIFDQVVFNGFVVNERVERGPYRTGAGRQWVIDLADPNVLINRRIMNGDDADRPAENDLERMQALLTMTELNTVDDDTYVNTGAATTDMDAVDYRGQNVGAYTDDCRQASGKNGYILYNEPLGQYGLWYDFAYSTAYDSGCFLTNTASEANHSTVFLYSQERTYLNRDPSRVASGIYLDYDGGTVYAQDAGTTAEFAAIDWAAPSVNVKTEAKAEARAERYLEDADTEHELIHTVMTKVPRANVNKVKKGQLVSFKAAWMPGYESYRVCRVLYRTVTEISEDPQASFEIEMDLDPQPEEVTALGILYYGATGGSDGIGPAIQFVWEHPSDGSGGCVPFVTVGPIVEGPIIVNLSDDSPKTGISGWTINAQGTIDIRMFGDVGGVAGTAIHTITLLMNGVSVFTHVFDDVSNPARTFDFTATITCPLTTANSLTATYQHNQPGGFAGVPAGTGGCGEYLQITGASLVEP